MMSLVFVADMPYSKPVVIFGGQISGLMDSSVTMFGIDPTINELNGGEDQRYQALDLIHGIDADLKLIFCDSLTDGILEELEKNNYDLVILISRHSFDLIEVVDQKISYHLAKHATVSGLFVSSGVLGDVIYEVANHAHCQVLVYRNEK